MQDHKKILKQALYREIKPTKNFFTTKKTHSALKIALNFTLPQTTAVRETIMCPSVSQSVQLLWNYSTSLTLWQQM